MQYTLAVNELTFEKRSTFVNLAGLLTQKAIPAILGKRWETISEITPQSLLTPTAERLEARVNDLERERLAAIFSSILEMNSIHPIPFSSKSSHRIFAALVRK